MVEKSSDGLNSILSNIDRTQKTSNELQRVHKLVIELKHPILASNEQTSNIEPNRARCTKFFIELTRTSNELERVHLLVIVLEHPIDRTLFDPSLGKSH